MGGRWSIDVHPPRWGEHRGRLPPSHRSFRPFFCPKHPMPLLQPSTFCPLDARRVLGALSSMWLTHHPYIPSTVLRRLCRGGASGPSSSFASTTSTSIVSPPPRRSSLTPLHRSSHPVGASAVLVVVPGRGVVITHRHLRFFPPHSFVSVMIAVASGDPSVWRSPQGAHRATAR